MFVAAILVGIAQKLRIPYPITLVLGGAVLGFIPGVPSIAFDPNLILVIVLPPILYYAAFGISFREFTSNWRDIFSLALGLVVVTTLIVGVVFKWLFPELPWALAFAFGAIISPPDAVAATTILKRFSISPRLLAILEGESLVNDASAIVLYRMAVIALLSGTFSLTDASFEFIKAAAGAVVLGFVLGFAFQLFSRRFLEPIAAVVFSFTIPYITFIWADSIGVSGVLAVVIVGLIGSRILVTHHSSLRRVIGYAVWDIFSILLNCFVFILIGLQLSSLTPLLSWEQMVHYSGYALLIALVMLLVRMAWVYAKNSIFYLRASQKPKSAILNESAIISWAGMRGIVSLTAALALPLSIPGREIVIVMTFLVILLTLVIPGLTLSRLTQWLKMPKVSDHVGVHKARKKLVKVSLEVLERLHVAKIINEKQYEFLTSYFNWQHLILEMPVHKKLQNVEQARLQVIQTQRQELFKMWERLEIDDKTLRQLEHDLDIEETHLARAELN